ncbi:MAG: hypothetical protein JMDDDDMK_03953 [Acidobacteria bacterium]|nr:hypothetical protein [Acidobacteriota bacterium]
MIKPLSEELTPEQWLEILPHEADLPSEDWPMESSLHALQLRLLVSILEWFWRERDDFFIGENLTIYFSYQQTKTHDFRGPDFFVVTGTERRHRKSWVVWDEGKLPELIIELLSDSTARNDRGLKKDIYASRFHTPEYFWYSPETGEFAGFRLSGTQYEEIQPDERGWRWSQVLNLYLGAHEGFLRYFTAEGAMLPTPAEDARKEMERAQVEAERAQAEAERAQAEAERAQAEAERAQAEAERAQAAERRVEQLAAKLRELGIDPNNI